VTQSKQERHSALRLAGYDAAVATDPLHTLLEQAFPEAVELSVVDRTGGGDHFQVTVTSPRFEGLTLVDQHKLVYEALAAPLADGSIHELRIKTKGTP
jgi:stress-induced morphogen